MRDRVPTPGRENRVKITQDDGTVVAGVLEYDDQATQEGSAYIKNNVLPDDVCNAYNIDKVASEPKDAFLAVPAIMGKALLTITVTKINGQPYPGVVVNGLSNIDTPRRTTNDEGKVVVYVDAGTYNLTFAPNPVCVDTSIPSKQVTVSAGGTGNVTTQETSNGLTSLDITSTKTIGFSAKVQNLDIFCVGGGGGGGGTADGSHSSGGGGGGGRTSTRLNAIFTPYTPYRAIIGNGGAGGSAGYGGRGGTGGTTSLLGINSTGGGGGDPGTEDIGAGAGGDGGSGGGSGTRNGGDDGSDGQNSGVSSGGQGQGSTTRAFGEPTGQIYSGGGGGGNDGRGGTGAGYGGSTGSPGGNATGYGGGGGGGATTTLNPTSGRAGGKGYQGLIKLRWVNAL